jgi:type IV secretion system protein VirD4
MTYAKMPLEASPWAALHDDADLVDYTAAVHGQGAKAAQLLGSMDSRTADSFLIGAQQALMGYAKATRAFETLKSSTFRFADMKRGGPPVTVFMIADPSRLAAQKTALALTQWAALTEFKRSTKSKRPVHVIADEATNFKVAGLADLLTWGRGYALLYSPRFCSEEY